MNRPYSRKMMRQRIRGEMDLFQIISVMSEGYSGAIMACSEIVKHSPVIDPDGCLGGFGPILDLDTIGIYGSRLYVLWSDVCKRDVKSLLAVLRAYQLGQLAGTTHLAIDAAIDANKKLDLEAILKAVQERLPRFAQGQVA